MRGYRGLGDIIRPEVEKPTGKTTVGRPPLLGLLLIGITLFAVLCAVAWLLNAGRFIGPWIGLPLTALTLLYAVQAVTLRWPPVIVWRECVVRKGKNEKGEIVTVAGPHQRAVLLLLGVGVLATVLWATGNWPAPTYPEGSFLWLNYKLWGVAGSRLGEFVLDNGVKDLLIIGPTFWLWARLIVAITIPVGVPMAVRLVWYRWAVEIVYPSVLDSATFRNLTWLDPFGLLHITGTRYGGAEPEIVGIVSAKPDAQGEL